jgi:hypothetical protein
VTSSRAFDWMLVERMKSISPFLNLVATTSSGFRLGERLRAASTNSALALELKIGGRRSPPLPIFSLACVIAAETKAIVINKVINKFFNAKSVLFYKCYLSNTTVPTYPKPSNFAFDQIMKDVGEKFSITF